MAPLLTQLKDEVPHPVGRFAQVLLTAFASAGSGDVLKVQEMMRLVCEQPGAKPAEGAPTCPYLNPQSAAVLGVALLAMGEEVGSDMVVRSLEHMLQYGDPTLVRRAVPFALALLHVSNPKVTVVDTLSRLSHDNQDPKGETAMAAILGMGRVGAGTNNTRVANL